MLKLEIGMSNKDGFTLVEILVVLLIIGITIGFALLAFGDFGAKRRVVMASEQFVNFVKLVQQQAIMETSTLGIYIDNNSYQALRFDSSSNWQQFPAHSIFRRHAFPAQATIQFQPKVASSHNPQIIINESGDMSAFKLAVRIKNDDVAIIAGHHNGSIVLDAKPSS